MNQKDVVNFANQAGQKVLEAVREIDEINVHASEKLFAQQLELGGTLLDGAVRNVELLTRSNNIPEFVKAQVQLTQEQGKQVLDGVRRSAETLKEAGQAINAVLEDSIKNARDNLKAVA